MMNNLWIQFLTKQTMLSAPQSKLIVVYLRQFFLSWHLEHVVKVSIMLS